MQYDEELARMRAQLLAKQDEEPPVFDDGARYLGQDPNMMQVGLFGRPKKPVAPPTAPPVNLQRRSILGLTPLPADLPAVVPPSAPKPTPQQIEQAVSQQQSTSSAPSSAPSASPLQSLADKALNAPMSRRDVLKRAGQAALQQVVPMPSVTDALPQIMPAAVDTMESLFPGLAARYGIADAFKSGALDAIATGIAEGAVPPEVYYTYNALRSYLEGNVPEKELKRMDKLQEIIDYYAEDFSTGEFLGNKPYNAVEKLYELLDKHKKHIPDYAIKDAYIKDAADKLPFDELEDFVGNNFVGNKSPSPNDLKAYYQSLEPPPAPPMPAHISDVLQKLGKAKPKGK
jgi:hypothetical protein